MLLRYLKFREQVLGRNLENLQRGISGKALDRREEISGQISQIREIIGSFRA